ncbi:MAG TPA: universal stress protein [Conexibacter sp.]|nr:universal stress protein [Conexibacter sp.]
MKLIVTGVDGGEGGKDAAALAVALAAGDDAEVLLTGVWPETVLPLPLLMGPQTRPLEEIERMLLATRADIAPRGITRPLSDLSPARALRRTAREEHAGLIAFGSAASAAPGHARAGRVARQVLHDAPCAVAIAASGVHGGPVALRRIVVGIDGGAESEAALTCARELAGALGAHLHVLAVLDDKLPLTFGPALPQLQLLTWEEVVERQRERADRLIERVRQLEHVTTAELRVGDPDAELALAAGDADLVVVGSRRWGPLSRVVIGSVAERLMRDAPCSLLLVPRPAQEAGER